MTNLRIPGPTPCPPEVLEAVGRQMINHRGPEFADLLARLTTRLKEVFQTRHDVLLLTTAGTGAMEAALVNVLSPGDKVLAVSIGVFGERFAQIAETYGAQVIRLPFPWGRAADPEEVRKALQANPGVKAVLVTHNETSTGVTNDLGAIARVIHGFDKLIIVDAISSLGSIPLPVDEWRLDVVATASQKGWMVPPGLCMLSMSERAWKAYETARMPRFYFDAAKAKSYAEKGQTPWTPAISIAYGLDVALEMLLAEGLDNVFARHRKVASVARDGVKGLGLRLFPEEERFASDTVTAVRVPEGVEGKRLVGTLREEHGVVVAGGQGELTGKIFRIGHLGYVAEHEVRHLLEALETALLKVGYQPSGVAAAP